MNEKIEMGIKIYSFFGVWLVVIIILKLGLKTAYKKEDTIWNYNFWLKNSKYGCLYYTCKSGFILFIILATLSYIACFIVM
jgi:hypothetical protein